MNSCDRFERVRKPPNTVRDFAAVESAEIAWIRERRAATGSVPPEAPLVGLALSGGGIRSAAFNMGVLQSLAHSGLLARVDYLSSVSGGGYIASCLTWLRAHVPASSLQRLGAVPLADGTGTVLDWLRAHGRYLITGKGLSGWTLGASILSGTLLNLFVLLPVILLFIGLASGDWFEFRWPPHLSMPGAGAVPAHDGFMLITIAGVALLALYLLATLVFALSTVLPPLRQLSAGQFLRQRLGELLGTAVTCIGIGMLPVLAGIEETAAIYLRVDFADELTRHLTWIVPLVTGFFSVRQANKQGEHAEHLRGCRSRAGALWTIHRVVSPRAPHDPAGDARVHGLARGVGAVRLHLRHQCGFHAQLLPQPPRRGLPSRGRRQTCRSAPATRCCSGSPMSAPPRAGPFTSSTRR